jgi:hypothetical protein
MSAKGASRSGTSVNSVSWLTHQGEDEIYEALERVQQERLPEYVHPDGFVIDYREREDLPNEVQIDYRGDWPLHELVTDEMRERTEAERIFGKDGMEILHQFFSVVADTVDQSLGTESDRPEYEALDVRPTSKHKGHYDHERAVKTLSKGILPTHEWPIYQRATAQDNSNVDVAEGILEEVEDDFQDTFQ